MVHFLFSVVKWRLPLLLIVVLSTLLLSSPAQAFDPHLRFPWPASITHFISGDPSTGGNGYSCNGHQGADYYALDFAFSEGSEVDSTKGGLVSTINFDLAGYGWYVDVDHGSGFVSRYAHLQSGSIVVSVNQIISQNQKLALSGHTGGNGTLGPHLHFRVVLNGVSYMPEPMSTSGSPAVPVTGFGNYGICMGVSSPLWGSSAPISNVLQNSGFETYPVFTEDGGQWQRTSGTNWAQLSGGAHDGTYYLEMNTGSAGGGASVWQRFAVNDGNWSNYPSNNTFVSTPDTWAVRGWMRTSNCSGATGTLAIWALNGPAQENGSTATGLTGSWKLFSATVHFSNNGHNRLQAQFYMDTVGCNYDFDGFTFVRNYANNTSFEDMFAYWNTYHGQSGSCTVNYAVYAGSPPDDGNYLETNKGTCTAGTVSIIQDVAAYPSVNDIYTVRIWIRSAGGSAISGTIALWGNGGMQENGWLGWSIGSGDFTWHEYSFTKTIMQSNHSSMRIELYLDTNGANYDFDGLQLSGGAGG